MQQLRNTTALAAIIVTLSWGARAQDQHAIDVPAQPLLEALNELSAETGTPILVRRDLLEGAESVSVTGPMSPRQALERMLAETSLFVRELPDESLVVSGSSQINFVTQNATEEPFDLDTLVLQGELRALDLQDSPTSAAIETGEQLERTGDLRLEDIVRRTPGVNNSQGDRGVAIRGVDQSGPGANARGSGLAVTTQIDGVALPSTRSTWLAGDNTWDVDQIEILRGPQSTQQGRNAIAGAVIVRTNDPTFEPEFRLRAEVGSRDFNRFALMGNTPLSDTLAFRFTAETFSEDGFISNPNFDGNADPREAESYRAKLLWATNDQFEAVLSYSYSDNERGFDLAEEPPFPNDFASSYDEQSNDEATQEIFSLQMSYEFDNGLRLESETSFLDSRWLRDSDADLTFAPISTSIDTANDEVFEQDLRLFFANDVYDGVIGLFYSDITTRETQSDIIDVGLVDPTLLSPLFSDFNFDTEIRNIALYGEVEIEATRILPGLSFTVGARYDYEEFFFQRATTFDPFVPPDFAESDESGETTFEAFLPKIGVTYDIDPDQSISLTYQRGYRAGGAQVNATTGALNEFDPEFVDNFELAYRGSYFEDRMRLRANVFYARYTDQQVLRQNDDFDRDIVNAGESEAYGGELAIEGEPTDRISLFGSVAFVETEFKDFEDNDGNVFPFASPFTASLGGQYEFTSEWALSANASYTAAAFQDVANTLEDDSRWIVNAQLTYENENGWLGGLYVRNLLDEEYATSRGAFVDQFGISPGFTNSIRIGEPRTVGLFAQRSF